MITGSGEVKLGTLAGPLLIASPNHTDVITGGTLSSTSHVSLGTINCPINALSIFPLHSLQCEDTVLWTHTIPLKGAITQVIRGAVCCEICQIIGSVLQ